MLQEHDESTILRTAIDLLSEAELARGFGPREGKCEFQFRGPAGDGSGMDPFGKKTTGSDVLIGGPYDSSWRYRLRLLGPANRT